jgi:hypothetical protein
MTTKQFPQLCGTTVHTFESCYCRSIVISSFGLLLRLLSGLFLSVFPTWTLYGFLLPSIPVTRPAQLITSHLMNLTIFWWGETHKPHDYSIFFSLGGGMNLRVWFYAILRFYYCDACRGECHKNWMYFNMILHSYPFYFKLKGKKRTNAWF